MARRVGYERTCVELRYEDPAFDRLFIHRPVFDELKERILSVVRGPSTKKPLLLMGPGGSGKSTFVNWLVKELLKELRVAKESADVQELIIIPVLVRVSDILPKMLYAPPGTREARPPVAEVLRPVFHIGVVSVLLKEIQEATLRALGADKEKARGVLHQVLESLSKRLPFRGSFLDRVRNSVIGRKFRDFLRLFERGRKLVEDPVANLITGMGALAVFLIHPVVGLVVNTLFLLFALYDLLRSKAKRGHLSLTVVEEAVKELRSMVEKALAEQEEFPRARILLIVDDVGDLYADQRPPILRFLWALELFMTYEGPSIQLLKVLVVRREFKAPPEAKKIKGLIREAEEEIVEALYEVMEFPALSEDEVGFVEELAQRLGYKLDRGVARVLAIRCMGCPRTICMALANVEAAKLASGLPAGEARHITLENVEEHVPWEIKKVHEEYVRREVAEGYNHYLRALEVASCMLNYTEEELKKVLKAYGLKPGDARSAAEWLIRSSGLVRETEPGSGIYKAREEHTLYPFGFLREDVLGQEGRLRVHKAIVEAFSEEARKELKEFKPEEMRKAEMVLWHAHAYLLDGGREHAMLAAGLEVGSALSEALYWADLPVPCVEAALETGDLAEALGKAVKALEALGRATHKMAEAGYREENMKELVKKARRLLERASGTKDEDRARYLYVSAARSLAWRTGSEEGLRMLEELEKEQVSKIRDDRLRLDALGMLLDVKASLHGQAGDLNKAFETLEEARRLLEEARARGLSEREYKSDLRVLTSREGFLLLSAGRLEKALERFKEAYRLAEELGQLAGMFTERLNMALTKMLLAENRSDSRLQEALKDLVGFCIPASRDINWSTYSRAECLAALACLAMGEDDEALRHAEEAFRIANEKRLEPYDVARAMLTRAYVSLVLRRAPRDAGALPPELYAYGLSVQATNVFLGPLGAYADARQSDLLTSLAILLMASRTTGMPKELLALDFAQKLFLASAEHKRAGHELLTRLLRDCASHLASVRSLEDEDFLRLYFLKKVLVM